MTYKMRPLKNLYSVIPAKEPESVNMNFINKTPDQVWHEIRRILYKIKIAGLLKISKYK